METSVLDAECVIDSLYEKKIIDIADWKRSCHEKNNYPVRFSLVNSNGVIIFDIEVPDGKFFISQSRLRIIACRYHFNADDIYSKCAV
jgi:hypothetical protein